LNKKQYRLAELLKFNILTNHQKKRNAVLGALLVMFAMVTMAPALDNGPARTPPMGWNPWNAFRQDFNEEMFKEILL